LGRMREKKVRGDLNKVTLQLPGKLILPWGVVHKNKWPLHTIFQNMQKVYKM
jgi:hypothetical protein